MNIIYFLQKKSWLLVSGALFLLFSAWLNIGSNQNTNNELIVGVMSGYPPFAQLDTQGNLVGFDIDVATLIAEKLGKKLVIKDMNLAPLLISLQQNKIDLILSGLCITQEREERMEMIYYQGKPRTTYPLVFWNKIPEDIAAINDLRKYPNAVICVEPGSSQEKFLLSFDSLNVCQISNPIDIVMNLKYGKALAAVIDPDIVPSLCKKNPKLKILDIDLPLEFQSKGCGIALNKKNGDLARKVTAIIDELKSNGVLAALEQKWFGNGE
jgi:ABC-type amino acid transport substrate-binding protein